MDFKRTDAFLLAFFVSVCIVRIVKTGCTYSGV